jgi:hypothetical protein
LRYAIAAAALALVHCGEVVVPTGDSQADAAAQDAPPLGAGIEVSGSVFSLRAVESGERVIVAAMWSEGHENLGVFAFEADSERASRLGSAHFRTGTGSSQLRTPSIAVSGARVAAAFARPVWSESARAHIRATTIEVFALDGSSSQPRGADYQIGAPGLLDGDTLQSFAATVASAGDGWLVLDMLADRRLRITRVDSAARVLSQRAFAVPFTVEEERIDRWVVRAQGDRFWIVAPSVGGRALSVSEGGVVDESARMPVGAQRSPVVSPCFSSDGSMDLGFSDARAAWVARVTERGAEPQRTLPWEAGMTLHECARPGLWLRQRAANGGYDVVDEATGGASCAAELAASSRTAEHLVSVAGPLAVVAEQRGRAFELRAVALRGCVDAR